MAETEQEVTNGPSQPKLVLAKPKLGGFGGSSFSSDGKSSGNLFGSSSVLRPPQLKPALGSNPFLVLSNTSESKDDPPKEEKPTETPEAPKFVPLGGNTVKTTNPVPTPSQASTSSSSGFVFGQNLSARVMVAEGLNNGDHSSSNGNTELLFSTAVASVANSDKDGVGVSTSEGGGGGGLAAAAAEYERSHARPPVLSSTAPASTGEEDETNVLQITCRLFAWEAGSWRERGRGSLRLNDGGAGARLVFRVLGSLRVVLNTKVWPSMVADRAGAKSLRITAADAEFQVKVFLIMASPSDILHLHRELTARIARASNLKTNSHTECEPYSAPPVDHLPDETGTDHKEDAEKTGLDGDNLENGEKESLKRKETEGESGVSPKRQCPEIVIE